MRKIGIFGGSFDPVHLGHVELGADAREQAGLDSLYFVPAKLQPFKLDKKATEGFHRVNMLKLALRNHPELEVSEFELEQDGISYTINTLDHFRDVSGEDARIYFLTGTDSFIKIHTWMRADEFLPEYSFIVGSRPGYMENELREQKQYLESEYGCEVIIINNTRVDVSSTEIREKVQKGQSLEGLVDPEVEKYIYENGLYA